MLNSKVIVVATATAIAGALIVLEPVREARSPTQASVAQMLGANVVVNDTPADIAQVVGWARDYHKWYWYAPSASTLNWSQLDPFYASLRSLGVAIMPDVELAPVWASSNGGLDGVPDERQHANYLGALVRHYSGALAALENYNEPNQNWLPVRFPADRFGAMTAQDYAAVKAADPNVLFVLAGMAGVDTRYLDQAVRNRQNQFDVLNFHWYANGDTTGGGVNPESGGLDTAIATLSDWRDEQAPGKPVWITEFGWDTQLVPNGVPSKIYAPEGAAANYLVRAIVMMQASGVDKAFAFIYRDPGGDPPGLQVTYGSAGLVTNAAEHDGRKKMGWYFLATLKSVLGEYMMTSAVSAGPRIYHYEYAVPGSSRRAAVMWARNGERDQGYTAEYSGPAGTLIALADGSTTGQRSATAGNVVLSERPSIVLYEGNSSPF